MRTWDTQNKLSINIKYGSTLFPLRNFKFIYTSSCSVYGLDKQNKLLTEKSDLNPISHYARMKIMSEKALLSNKNDIFKPTIFRLGTVFGPSLRNRFDLVVNTMAKNAAMIKLIFMW